MEVMWTDVCALDQLPAGGARVYRQGRTQVAVFRTEAGELHAVDNRCPHEGYPLVQGTVKPGDDGPILTCTWHNFKFNLCSGACVMGDEAVRTFPVRAHEGRVQLDLAPRDRSQEEPRLWASLEAALLDHRPGQIARDVVRLLDLGVAPERIAGFGACFDAERGEYGPSHAVAVANDVLAWLPAYPGLRAALPLCQMLDVAAEAQARRPPRPRAAPVAVTAEELPGVGERLIRAVEAEDVAEAEGLLRGALAAGARRAQVEPWLYRLCADHFLDFGHALIYQGKVFDLLERVGWAHADLLLGAHLVGIVTGTREDLLPAWAGFRKRYAGVDPFALAARPRRGHFDPAVLMDGSAAEAFAAVVASDAPLAEILDALTLAAAERLYRFDVGIDGREGVQDSWLDITHRLTFVDALRTAAARWEGPGVWRLLLMATHFVAGARAYDGPVLPVAVLPPDPAALLAALDQRDSYTAVGTAAAMVRGGEVAALRSLVMARCLADTSVRGVVVAHLMKTTLVAFSAAAVTGDPRPVLALVRVLASPILERRIGRRVAEAIRLIEEGKPPERIVE